MRRLYRVTIDRSGKQKYFALSLDVVGLFCTLPIRNVTTVILVVVEFGRFFSLSVFFLLLLLLFSLSSVSSSGLNLFVCLT